VKRHIPLLLAAACLALIACGGEAEHGEHDEHAEQEGGASLALSPAQIAAAGIAIAEVGPGPIDGGSELLGDVHANGDRLAHIFPRFPGIAVEVRANAGDLVQAGETLAVIESSDSLANYALKTLIGGVVLSKHLTRGEAVDREKQAFTIADLSTVWVELSVYQRDLADVTVGQHVHIHVGGQDHAAEGVISYVTPAVDEITRSATARVVLDNPERRFLPGMFVTAHVLDPEQAQVAIPRDAIQTIEGRHAVFVATPEGFALREVALGREGETTHEVLSGLAPGERIAVTNTFLLKAELGRAEATHEH
jgi:cobalt-zinc-cadmium efflux system membrane fusion protein